MLLIRIVYPFEGKHVAGYRVAIVGAGFGGLFAAKFLKRGAGATFIFWPGVVQTLAPQKAHNSGNAA